LQLFLSFGGGSAHRHCHLHSGSIQGTESDPKSLCPCRKTSLFENRIKNSGKRPSWALLSSCTSFFPMLLYRRNKDLSKSGVSGIPCDGEKNLTIPWTICFGNVFMKKYIK